MDPDGEITKSDDIIEASLEEDRCLFHAESGKYWTFTRTSARVWDLLSQPRTPRALCAVLAEEFDAPLSTVERDVEAFVAFLIDSRLVRLTEPVRA